MYTLRQATDDDYDFLYQLHVATIRDYVEPIWGWDEAWQQNHFQSKWDAQPRQIIQVDGQDAGVLIVEEQLDSIFLALIELVPTYQGQGVGTAVVTHLVEQAKAKGLAVTLQVLQTNIPAQRLYQRLGFRVIKETDRRQFMRYG